MCAAESEKRQVAGAGQRADESCGDQRPRHSVQEVLLRFGEEYLRQVSPNPVGEGQVLTELVACRTAAMGGRLLQCPGCGHETPVYNGCQNRCCPTCQAMNREVWIERRMGRMLPVGHFHVVFTLPSELRELAWRNKRRVTYRLLHEAAWETLQGLAKEQLEGAQLGVTVILHTWSRALVFHPHVHCIVTSGGLSRDGRSWVASQPDFLFSIEEMRARFRDVFLRKLRRRQWLWPLQLSGCEGWDGPGEFELRCAELAGKQWIAYVQEPFTDVSALTRYLGQYTHRIAISDWRILEVGEQTVQVATRGDESVTLDGIEFVRRFMLHLPPSGLSRIHHYGLYSAAGVRLHLSDAWSLVAPGRSQPTYDPDERWDARLERLRGVHPHQCPRCRKATMQASRLLEPLARRFAGRFHQRMQRMLR